jgi:predicted PurR-regulated permease PerM
MLGFEACAARYTWTAAWVLLLMGLVYLIRGTLFIFIVALLFAYLLWPLVHFLEHRLPVRSRIPSLAIVYLLLLGLLIVCGIVIGSRIAGQAAELSDQIPKLLEKLQHQMSSFGQGAGLKIQAELPRQLADHSRDLIMFLTKAILSLLSHAEILLFVVLVPILSFFFLKDGQSLLSSLIDAVSKESSRKIINDIAGDLHLLLAGYMRALVLLGLSVAAAYAAFFSLIGLRYGLLLGAIAFFLEFIPMVGPLTSAAIVLLVAGMSGSGHFVWIVIFLAAYRLFQDYILSPRLLSSGTELHPLLVIFGVLAGGQIAGIPGAFLSVPVIATLRIIYRQIQKKRSLATPLPKSR